MPNTEPVEILLVEDNPGDARLAIEALKENKVCNNLHHVKDGVEAMALLRREGRHADAPTPDLILLDLNMLRKDGREVLAEVKEDPALRLVPIVILTTSAAERDLLQSYDLHANAYVVVKPLDLELPPVGASSWPATGSTLPTVASPGFSDEPACGDDHLGEDDPEVDDPVRALGTPN